MANAFSGTAPDDDSSDFDLLVVGLGYVGLPLAQAATAVGLSVAGYDTSDAVIQSLLQARSHVDDLSAADVWEMLQRGFTPSNDPDIIARARAIAICVPTPLMGDRSPDLSAVRDATAVIAPRLAPQTLVVLESTTYPGTTEEVLLTALAATGQVVGIDFFLAFSPERVDPGNPHFGIRNTPKIVGGVTPACAERAAALYGKFVGKVIIARGTREAEMAKLLENTYRHVNIALVNELARFAHEMDIDIWDVIRCAASKPFGFQAFFPGPGVGGHCIPIDPNYLSFHVRSKLGSSFRFVELAEEINSSMPRYIVQRVQAQLNRDGLPVKETTILLVGVAYKADVGDARETPAREIAQRLAELGARVSYFDPHVPHWPHAAATRVDDVFSAAQQSDIVVLLQTHSSLDLNELVAHSGRVFDARGVTSGPQVEVL